MAPANALYCVLVLLLSAAALSAEPSGRPPLWAPVPGAAVDEGQLLHMTVGLVRSNMAAVDKVFWEVSDPRHEKYGEHLRNSELRALVAPSPQGLRTVLHWLTAAGAANIEVSSLEDAVAFRATVGTVRRLLSVAFRVFEHGVTKERVTRAVGPEAVPERVAPFVEVISGHRGFPLARRQRPVVSGAAAGASGSGSSSDLVTPDVLYNVYNVTRFPATPSGATNVQSFFQAQSEAVVASDLTAFCKKLLPASLQHKCEISMYIGDKNQNQPSIESALDSQYIFATSHGQETWVWTYNSGDFCADLLRWATDVLNRTAKTPFPYVISMSYGSQTYPNICGATEAARLDKDIQMMGTLGISVIIASGDYGSGEYYYEGEYPVYNGGHLQPAMPSTIPYATAVGATTFLSGVSGEETAVTAFGSGGGFSYSYDMPDYQAAAVKGYLSAASSLPPAKSYHKGGRATPDVSALGWNFDIIVGGQWMPIGGTSASTPTFAGFVTLLNNVRLQNNKTLGFLNPLLYQNPEAFTDITVGNNDVFSDGMGWVCAKGWDPVTGLGTPNVGLLFEVVDGINSAENKRRL